MGYDARSFETGMSTRPRRSSARVTLVLLGAAALASCGHESTLRRDLYANKEDCLKDWGDELKCAEQPAPAQGGSAGGYHGGYWYGPFYRSGSFGSSSTGMPHGTVDAARPGSHAIATSHISRGGFGAGGAAHASSGS
jgi:uncharacterized protein YgiB involved in biofilm formation